nr:MAG TPA: tail protein [Caudoviricetes sp.]
MNITDYTNIKTLLVKFKEKSDVLYAKASALSNYATIEWVGTQIPSVGNGTVTIKQNGTSKGSFTMNQSGGATINLTDTTYSSLLAVSGGADKSLVTTGEKYTWNNKWDYNATTIAGVKVNNAVAADKAPWSGITGKPTTLSGYGITDASRFFRYTIPASGNKGVRITFTSGEPVKITVSGANRGAQLVLIGTGYGEGGFIRNNFTEVVPSINAVYTWCVSEENACSVEIFSQRADQDFVIVESPSLVTFTAISALSTDAAYRHLLTSANYSSYALPLTGGTMTGDAAISWGINDRTDWDTYASGIRVMSSVTADSGAPVQYATGISVMARYSFQIAAKGGNADNFFMRAGTRDWKEILHTGNFIDGVNYISPKTTLKGYGIEDWVIKYTEASPDTLQTAGIYRVSTTGVIGKEYNFPYGQVLVLRGGPGSDTITQIAAPYNNSNLYFRSGTLSNFTDASHPWRTIFNSGNCNLPTVPWTCLSLTATNDVTAKAGLYGQYLEFTSIGSSAGHGGFIDFHFNGNTADYTSRIIEDASGQITIKAGVLNIGTSAKGFLYLQRPSSNYIWANKAGGEICIGTADGGETSALNSGITIIGKRVYIGGTNSGSNALNVKGAIHATTGLYTDGYISAKQASASSDRRLKKDFCKIDNALKYVLKTHYTRFRWKDDNKESIGIIAQEEQNREYGFLVQNRKEIGHLTYDYAASTALLGAAIQEEDSKVEKLRKRIIKLENELSNLKKKWQH